MNPRTVIRWMLTVLVAIAAVGVAACGSDDAEVTADETDMDMGMDDADMGDMNMGDPNATPAAEVEGAEVLSGMFELLETRPEGYDEMTGTADIARSDAGTTVTLQVSGLIAGEDYISHLHDGPCSDLGGDHYRFDPGGSEFPPNEIHLAFTADGDGNGFMTAENEMTAGPEAISIVVHPAELLDNKIACAEFE